MTEVQGADVEDVLQLPGVGGIGSNEGLQSWEEKEGEGGRQDRVSERPTCPGLTAVLCPVPCQATQDPQQGSTT